MQKELVDSRWKAFPVDKKDVRRLVNLKTSALFLANGCCNCILQVFLAISGFYVSGITF